MHDIINTSHRYKCIFIHIPKVAGTSIKLALGLPGGGHPPWQYFHQNYPVLWQQYTSFTVIRNPWDRLVSAYRYAQMKESYWHSEKAGLHPDYHLLKDRSFEDLVSILHDERTQLKHESWHNQTEWLVRKDEHGGKITVDQVLRYENLTPDFNKLCRMLGIRPIELQHTNRSASERDYEQFYNEHTRNLVGEIYRSDIEYFEYSFNQDSPGT